MAQQSQSRKKTKNTNQHNWPGTVDNIVNRCYSFASSGNLVGLLVIMAFVWVMTVTYRMPPKDLPRMLEGIAHFLENCHWITVLVSSYAIVSTIIFTRRDKDQRQEIKRLTDLRKKLIHGLENATLKPLDKHTSSGFDIMEKE